jgi:hypothetical protein
VLLLCSTLLLRKSVFKLVSIRSHRLQAFRVNTPAQSKEKEVPFKNPGCKPAAESLEFG